MSVVSSKGNCSIHIDISLLNNLATLRVKSTLIDVVLLWLSAHQSNLSITVCPHIVLRALYLELYLQYF